MKFCSLCYGAIKPIEDARYECKRCGSTFDTMGELIFRRNEHIAPEVAAAIDAGALPIYTVDGQVNAVEAGTAVPMRTDGSDWLDYAVTPEETAQREAHFAAMRDLTPVVTEAFAYMRGEDADTEYVAVETLTRNKATGEVKLSRIPLSQWPEWAAQLRMGRHGI